MRRERRVCRKKATKNQAKEKKRKEMNCMFPTTFHSREERERERKWAWWESSKFGEFEIERTKEKERVLAMIDEQAANRLGWREKGEIKREKVGSVKSGKCVQLTVMLFDFF
jgi:hypothetical protein